LAIPADPEKVLAATYLRHPDVVQRTAASHPRIYSGAFHLRPLLSASMCHARIFYRTSLYLFLSDVLQLRLIFIYAGFVMVGSKA
jgi:hypothetical protein